MQVLKCVQECFLKNILSVFPVADDPEYPLLERSAISLAQFGECLPISSFRFGKQLVIGGLLGLDPELCEYIGAHKVPYRGYILSEFVFWKAARFAFERIWHSGDGQ
jgi:hypothetical protein